MSNAPKQAPDGSAGDSGAADDKPRAGVNQFMHSPAIFTPFGHPTNFTPPHHPSPAQVLKTRSALVDHYCDELKYEVAERVVDHLIRNGYLSERAYIELGGDERATGGFVNGGAEVRLSAVDRGLVEQIAKTARGPIV